MEASQTPGGTYYSPIKATSGGYKINNVYRKH